MSPRDAFVDACHQILRDTASSRENGARQVGRIEREPHFAVMRDCIEKRDVRLVPGGCEAVLARTPDGVLLFPPDDMVQLPIVSRYGSFQRDDLLVVLRFLSECRLLRGKCFVDVGANVGSHTLHAMRSGHFARGIAIEPFEPNFRLLEMNLRLNGISDRVQALHLALGNREGSASLVNNPGNCGDCRVEPVAPPDEPLFGEAAFHVSTAPITTLDRLVADRSLDPVDFGLVWMDTQGSEGLILEGAHVLQGVPVPLYVEFWPYGMRALDSYRALRAFVVAHCSSVVRFVQGRPEEHEPEAIDQLFAEYDRGGSFCDLLLLRS